MSIADLALTLAAGAVFGIVAGTIITGRCHEREINALKERRDYWHDMFFEECYRHAEDNRRYQDAEAAAAVAEVERMYGRAA